ncbi:MAG: sugar ABC transporter ATP-binding protein [Pseudomonadota bacterium]|nr:sugar ABC transporter ATP-binding protein [Pseudomonadota bacterium]
MNTTSTLSAYKAGPPLLSVHGLHKRFPGVHALKGVDFDLLAGEVHSLVGENGAGKSTLIKMITGALHPDEGAVKLAGTRVEELGAHERRARGVNAIYQELNIVPAMSAAANVFLDAPPMRGPFLDRKAANTQFEDLCARLEVSIPAQAPARSLSIADRQMIEIMRALSRDAQILIMDEPTATLGPSERQKLYGVIEGLRAEGKGIIFISHDLGEVLDISDRITVMRNGAVVDKGPRSGWTRERMVHAMVGEARGTLEPRAAETLGGEVLRIEGLALPGRLSDVSLAVRKGEILGIAGLVGAGRSELLRSLAGLEPTARADAFAIDGQVLPALPASVRQAIGAGIVLVPEDRKNEGFVPLMDGDSNVALSDLGSVTRHSFVDRKARHDLARGVAKAVGFAPERLSTPVRNLSGGNQQKLVIGKWLHIGPKVLLLDEPTRGVDIGAKADLYRAIRDLTKDGLSVILVSSELEEVLEHSDRIAVLTGHTITETLDRKDATMERVLSLIFAQKEAS